LRNLGDVTRFKTIQTEGIAELSYLVGDDDEGVAAVFDPRADCGETGGQS
jgi:hypothetical protein